MPQPPPSEEPRATMESKDDSLCAICFDRPSGARLRPCGHNYFCQICVQRLFRCPLCRAPLLRENGQNQLGLLAPTPEQVASEMAQVAESRWVLTQQEGFAVQSLCFGVWAFIFIFGFVEHMHGLVRTCDAGDPAPDTFSGGYLTVPPGEAACQVCIARHHEDCTLCMDGFYNLGTACFKYLENIPAMQTGAALGGAVYFVLIISTQVLGIISEVLLICRLVRRQLMPRKELVVLVVALLIEVFRMFLVDIFVMQEYFGGRSYHIFRKPISCSERLRAGWQGADGHWYCDDNSSHGRSTEYYIAAFRSAWSGDREECSTFSLDSALLNFDEVGQRRVPGHTRFKTLGWILGGEFALYYFFATFINEVADNMFVIPTTTRHGWFYKIFSIALEMFQLGALCPAAVFTHGNCLFFTDPLGVSLHTMSTIVIVFGYFIWAFIFVSFPLAAVGFGVLFGLSLLIGIAALLAPILRAACSRSSVAIRVADGLERSRDALAQTIASLREACSTGLRNAMRATMLLAFVPLLCSGVFLGTLVVVGQGSKKGWMQSLTAVVLLSDVLFKIFATAAMEVGDYLLHRRVWRAVRARERQPQEQEQEQEDQNGESVAGPVSTVVGRATEE